MKLWLYEYDCDKKTTNFVGVFDVIDTDIYRITSFNVSRDFSIFIAFPNEFLIWTISTYFELNERQLDKINKMFIKLEKNRRLS